jgi:hypothetical protein
MTARSVCARVKSVLTGCLLLVAAFSAMADQREEPPRHCIPIHQIDRIEVVDDQTLLFHLHGHRTYINILPYRCSGLKHNAFLHETSLASYCDLDVISVLNVSLGMRMGSCPLGKFQVYEPTLIQEQES